MIMLTLVSKTGDSKKFRMRKDDVFDVGRRRKEEKEIERSLICMTEKVSEARRRQGREGQGESCIKIFG